MRPRRAEDTPTASGRCRGRGGGASAWAAGANPSADTHADTKTTEIRDGGSRVGLVSGMRRRHLTWEPEAGGGIVWGVRTSKKSKPVVKAKASSSSSSPASSYQRIYAVVARIPRGKVATYGQVAALADLPRQARLVGYALNVLPAGTRVPWHRVVNAKGEISLRSNGLGHDQIQAQLLTREGVRIAAGKIPLDKQRWQPRGGRLG
jgi:methylated-DNA-protein-cysteine methyltransferase-like protein